MLFLEELFLLWFGDRVGDKGSVGDGDSFFGLVSCIGFIGGRFFFFILANSVFVYINFWIWLVVLCRFGWLFFFCRFLLDCILFVFLRLISGEWFDLEIRFAERDFGFFGFLDFCWNFFFILFILDSYIFNFFLSVEFVVEYFFMLEEEEEEFIEDVLEEDGLFFCDFLLERMFLFRIRFFVSILVRGFLYEVMVRYYWGG